MSKAVLITAPIGHTATRLLVEILMSTGEFYMPPVNYVKEFDPLHQYFIDIERKTPIDLDVTYSFDQLSFLLDAYTQNWDSEKMLLLKMPFYPLSCLEMFYKYFNNDLTLLYIERNIPDVIRSFKNRGEDISFFKNPSNHFHYVKKLPVVKRKYFLLNSNFEEFIESLFEIGNQSLKNFPSESIIKCDTKNIQDFASIVEILNQLQVNFNEKDVLSKFNSILDQKRLNHNNSEKKRQNILVKIYNKLFK